ncbi:hypothetical protein ES332_D06G207000v1 [Gossypium tomentosum]|uniref:Uncharacterized protein n=1 Tax=Gossypium tomentosum TaxID=34277 RepID=A0A5D2KKP7_GOSTO|nr:hypothetical protein ES332_D06G207000v1 [Gossypium tomentosum]
MQGAGRLGVWKDDVCNTPSSINLKNSPIPNGPSTPDFVHSHMFSKSDKATSIAPLIRNAMRECVTQLKNLLPQTTNCVLPNNHQIQIPIQQIQPNIANNLGES